jgi:hypothetical protein
MSRAIEIPEYEVKDDVRVDTTLATADDVPVRRPHHDRGRRPGLNASDSDERRVDRRVEDRPLGRRRQRLREQRHGPVHLRC